MGKYFNPLQTLLFSSINGAVSFFKRKAIIFALIFHDSIKNKTNFHKKLAIIFALFYQIPSWICKFDVFKTNMRDGMPFDLDPVFVDFCLGRGIKSQCRGRVACQLPMGNALWVPYATKLDRNMGWMRLDVREKVKKREIFPHKSIGFLVGLVFVF